MKITTFLSAFAWLAASSALVAQSPSSSFRSLESEAVPDGGNTSVAPEPVPMPSGSYARRFSKVAFGAGLSPLGAQVSMSTNLNHHFNLRTSGNVLNYSTNFTASGIGADARLAMKSVGTSLDVYPFHLGFRISPGFLLYNGNQLAATATVPSGASFTLNNQTYYSDNANPTTGASPVNGNAVLNLHTNNPAFTLTTGWGNTMSHTGHWSFPFEVGAAFTGAPSLKVNLGGWACYDQAQTLCTDITSQTDPIALQIQNNLALQVAKWTKAIEPLKTYPVALFGVAYSFGLSNR